MVHCLSETIFLNVPGLVLLLSVHSSRADIAAQHANTSVMWQNC